MKQKVTLIIGAILIATLSVATVSCKTLSGVFANSSNIRTVSDALKVGTQLGVSATVAQKPGSVPYFEAVVVAIKVVLGGNDLTPATVVATINTHVRSVNNFGSYYSSVVGAVGLALDTYKIFYETNGQNVSNSQLAPLLKSIQAGVENGIRTTKPVSDNNPLEELTEADLILK